MQTTERHLDDIPVLVARRFVVNVRRSLSALFFYSFIFLFFSCTEQKEHTAPAILDRDSVSMMTSYGVNTLISDSGYIQSDTAWYYDQKRLWHLRGRVRLRNVNGLIYTSEELFWDGVRHEFYSNVFSRVVTPERTMQGTYFRSDEQMTHYFVSNSKGSFMPDDMMGEEEKNPTEPADTTKPAPPLRQPAAPRAASPKPATTP